MNIIENISGDLIQRSASFIGAGLLISPQAENSFAVWALVISSVAGFIKQFLDARNARLKDEQAHRFAMEDRAALQDNTKKTIAIGNQLKEATRSVNDNVTAVGDAAKTALDAANHVNEKIALIATKANVQAIKDTNETAHRIENKL